MNEGELFAKCARRLIPFIMLLYVVNYIDRVNVGFAALTMNKDLGLSAAVFGLGSGVFFFVGYLLFQMPANLVLERMGARRWLFLILLVWGAISSANALISGPLKAFTRSALSPASPKRASFPACCSILPIGFRNPIAGDSSRVS